MADNKQNLPPKLPPIMRSETDPSAIADRDEAKKQLRKSVRHIFFYIAILVVVGLVLFLFPSIRPPRETIPSWVERFGALIGIASVMIELELTKMNSRLNAVASILPSPLFSSLKNQYCHIPVYERIALCFAIVGAVTWAYGSVVIYWTLQLFKY